MLKFLLVFVFIYSCQQEDIVDSFEHKIKGIDRTGKMRVCLNNPHAEYPSQCIYFFSGSKRKKLVLMISVVCKVLFGRENID